MPVDVVSNRLNIKDLVITQREKTIFKFDPNRDISPEKWVEAREALEQQEPKRNGGKYWVTTFAYLSGKITKNEIPKATLDFIKGQTLGQPWFMFMEFILDPESIKTLYETRNKEDDYLFLKNEFLTKIGSSQYGLFVLGTVFSDLFNKDEDFKKRAFEIVKNELEYDSDPALLMAEARVAFPESDLWKKYETQEFWQQNIDQVEAYPGSDEYIGEFGIPLIILSADRIKVDESGLKLEFGEKPEFQEPSLPERRKY